AARGRNLALVTLLLEHGADPRHHAPDGVTALGEAAQRSLPCARLLLERGADANGRDARGHTPLMGACWLHEGTADDQERWIEELLRAGADPEARTPAGESVIEHATRAKADRVLNRLRRLSSVAPPRVPSLSEPLQVGTARSYWLRMAVLAVLGL